MQVLQLPDPTGPTNLVDGLDYLKFALKNILNNTKSMEKKHTLLNREISYIYISSISMGHFQLFSMAPLNHQRVFKCPSQSG